MTTHKRNRLRGRRIALWFWGCVILSQVVVGLLLDYVWPQIRFPQAYHQFRRLGEFPHSPDIVCLGSSRTESSVHDWLVSQAMRHFTGDESILVFNAHVPGGDLIAAEHVWNGLRQRGAHPSVLVIEVCPEEVNHQNDWLKLHALRQLTWEDLPAYTSEVFRTQHIYRLVQARLFPVYVHRKELWKTAGRCLPEWLLPSGPAPVKPGVPAGYQDVCCKAEKEQPVSAGQREESYSGLHGVERGLRNYRPGGTSTKALERILAQCREHEIRVILLGIPVSSPHRQLYTPEIDASFRGYLEHLEQRYSCHFVDCRDRVPDWLFRDNHHATPLGGDYFSQRLAREVLLPTWSQVGRAARPAVAAR